MFAVVEISGKQYRITPNTKIQVDSLGLEPGNELTVDKVLLLADDNGDKCEVGKPYIDKEIKAKVVELTKGDKIIVYKKKAKKRYERKIGHRQDYTILEFKDI